MCLNHQVLELGTIQLINPQLDEKLNTVGKIDNNERTRQIIHAYHIISHFSPAEIRALTHTD